MFYEIGENTLHTKASTVTFTFARVGIWDPDLSVLTLNEIAPGGLARSEARGLGAFLRLYSA